MDTQRIILIGSLAVVTYMLILAWNDDYGQEIIAETTTTQSPVQMAPIPNNVSQDAPNVSLIQENDLSANQDMPRITELNEVNQSSETPSPASHTNVTLSNDVVRVTIDPVGGDIVEVALVHYAKRIEQPENPFLMLEKSAARTYIAQTGLIGPDGPDAATTGRPVYSHAANSYALAENQETINADLVLEMDDVTITKRFSLSKDSYTIRVTHIINNKSTEIWQGTLFAQLKRDNTEDPTAGTSMGMKSFLGAATTSEEERYLKLEFDDFTSSPYKHQQFGGWIAILQHYFVSAWVADESDQYTYQTRKNSRGENIAGLIGSNIQVNPGDTTDVSAQLYAGPKIQERLKDLSPALELTIDYGWLWFIAQPLFWLLSTLHSFLGNWGWAIVFTTLVIKLIFFQLSATSYKSMANMRRVGPELQRLKERFGDDRQKMSAAMMELYKKEKINPLGGCLPILVQMPVFIALYWVLLESVELRHSPFILWLNDLSVKDPYFVLPILMGATMFFQQTLNPEPPDPMQARVMKMMPIMFTFFFLWFPAGLVLYWLVNNMLSIAQQWVITRQIEKAAKT